MLVSFSHGQNIPLTTGQQPADCGHFGYYFPDADIAPFAPAILSAIDDLVKDMVEQSVPAEGNHSSLPPIWTYFGQFVDHDITGLAKNPKGESFQDIDAADIAPEDRDALLKKILNARSGRFDLDSLYGTDGPTGNEALDKLNSLLRFPGDRAMMWLGTFGKKGGRLTFPKDPAGDLLRLDRLISSGRFTKADVEDLPEEHCKLFTSDREEDDNLNLSRAVIGDARNDENLFIAQLHMAFLRFHNRVVQAWPHGRKAGDEDEVYEWARKEVRKFYQWLVLNVWLPAVCDPKIVRDILANGPVLYDDFLTNCNWTPGDRLPLPLEFSTACYRFGHSTVRAEYDWNTNFPDAGFRLMFGFTGSSNPPMLSQGNRLPENWGADWDRLVHPVSAHPGRSTRLMDTVLADPLSNMSNEGGSAGDVIRNLLARNLRRGVQHNLPSAQQVVTRLNKLGLSVNLMTKAQIASGETAGEIKAAKFDTHTPLWFYTLKEAELLQRGQRLGPVGSHIVAGTIVGLLLRGEGSVWDEKGSNEGRWHPVDGPRVSGQLVDSFPALMRAALLMHNPDV